MIQQKEILPHEQLEQEELNQHNYIHSFTCNRIGDTLMTLSPGWVLPIVLIIGVAVSVCITNVTAKLFKIEKN